MTRAMILIGGFLCLVAVFAAPPVSAVWALGAPLLIAGWARRWPNG